MKKLHRKSAFIAAVILLILALGVIAAVTIAVGPVPVPLKSVIAILKDRLLGTTTAGAYSQSQFHIIWNIRMPRILMAIVAGSGLAVSGAVMQAIVRNPIADPYVLGVSSGASTGAAIALLLPSALFSTGASPSPPWPFWAPWERRWPSTPWPTPGRAGPSTPPP